MSYNKKYRRYARAWLDAKAQEVDTVLSRQPAFADDLAAWCNTTRLALQVIIAHMRNEQGRKILTVGRGDSLAYEYAAPTL